MTRIMYDSTTVDDIPADAEIVAYYPYAYPGNVSRFTGSVVGIDNEGSHPELAILDVESGAATVADVPGWLDSHETKGGSPGTLYCNKSTMPPLVKAVGSRKCYLWIADPTGSEHEYQPDPALPANITQIGTQYAWPSIGSPGHYDMSEVVDDSWYPPEAIVPEVTGARVNPAIAAIEEAGLIANVSSGGPRNPDYEYEVISQTPGGETRMPRGGTLDIAIRQIDPAPAAAATTRRGLLVIAGSSSGDLTATAVTSADGKTWSI
jgi:hypothetical protein